MRWKELFPRFAIDDERPIANNTALRCHARGALHVRYYDIKLFTVYENGSFMVRATDTAISRTTRARMKALLPYGCYPIQDGGKFYLKTPQGITPMSDNRVMWNALGRCDLPEEVNRLNFIELRKKAEGYAHDAVRRLLKGELLDNAARPLRECLVCFQQYQQKNLLHILGHLRETRTPPVELINGALCRSGRRLVEVVEQCTPRALERLEKNIRQSRRDPEKIIIRTEHRLRTGKPPPVEYIRPQHFRRAFEEALIEHLLWNMDCE